MISIYILKYIVYIILTKQSLFLLKFNYYWFSYHWLKSFAIFCFLANFLMWSLTVPLKTYDTKENQNIEKCINRGSCIRNYEHKVLIINNFQHSTSVAHERQSCIRWHMPPMCICKGSTLSIHYQWRTNTKNLWD